MSAITLVNNVPAAVARVVEFLVYQHSARDVKVSVTAGARAMVATSESSKRWTTLAMIRGITSPVVSFVDPNATVTLTANSTGDQFALQVS